MRIPTLVIPIALVAGYAGFHALRGDGDTRAADSLTDLSPAALPASEAEATAPLALVTGHPTSATHAVPLAHARGTDEAMYVHAEVTASIAASLDGIVDLVSHELEANADQFAEAHRLIELTTSIAGEVAAELDGYLEIRTPDGERIQLSTSTAGRSR